MYANVLGIVLNDVVTKGKYYGYQYENYRNYAAYQSYCGVKHKGSSTKRSKSG